MFDIGFWEIAVIGVIALLVIGPERLPGVARNVGRWVGRIRRYVSHVKQDIEREIHADEVRQLLENPEGLDGIRDIARETASVIDDTRKELGGLAQQTQNSILDPASKPPASKVESPSRDDEAPGTDGAEAAEANAWVSGGASYEARDKLAERDAQPAAAGPADRLVPHHALDEDPFAAANLASVSPHGDESSSDKDLAESTSAAHTSTSPGAEPEAAPNSDSVNDEQRTERSGQR